MTINEREGAALGGLLFFNGPVHNGGFTFTSRPGKATGIRLAAALNQLLGSEPVPHLWNTVTLAGDLRHLEHAATAGETVGRAAFEAGLIAAKYGDGRRPAGGIVTDADPQVAALALEMIEARLSTGALSLSTERIPHCPGCGHMAGTGAHPCQVCGNETLLARPRRVLVAERALDRPALDFNDVHAHHKRAPVHLRNIAGNVPARLILSRTRDHGISLEPLGLPEMVLDPRAGLHIAVLAAARARGAETAVMVLTQNAAANVAAYGQPFLRHHGSRLLYGLHGHIPYDHIQDLTTDYQRHRLPPAVRASFETWFLPLYSWHAKNHIGASQLAALLTHFHRARLTAPERPQAPAWRDIQQAVEAGSTTWLTRKAGLATAVSIASGTAP
ncbi:hypothetical protein [Streptomyces sp. RKCA744]|uniref:hypothetical protein n=1 Tax=Streptomyces sp. RKCA744 TaxID=2959340 RepID=UPI00209EC4C7|nr:hypothetical protein [Streptomyces sp. RKCA744]MCO8303624.1 hypothetical protein [Streptomyces sp. RKCA744]